MLVSGWDALRGVLRGALRVVLRDVLQIKNTVLKQMSARLLTVARRSKRFAQREAFIGFVLHRQWRDIDVICQSGLVTH